MRGIIRRGIYVASNCKAVGTKYTRNNRENFRVSCNNKIDGECLYEWQVYVAIHRGISMIGNLQRRWAQVSRENIGDYLRNLLVQQAIICNKGNSGWM